MKFYEGMYWIVHCYKKSFAENTHSFRHSFRRLKSSWRKCAKTCRILFKQRDRLPRVGTRNRKKPACWNFVFSSSATVYGDPEIIPDYRKLQSRRHYHPYGTSKFMVEQILRDIAKAEPKFSMTICAIQSSGRACKRLNRRGPKWHSE